MERKFFTTTIDKKRLNELINKVDGAFVTLGIEIDYVYGDKLLWVSNSEFGDKRIVVN